MSLFQNIFGRTQQGIYEQIFALPPHETVPSPRGRAACPPMHSYNLRLGDDTTPSVFTSNQGLITVLAIGLLILFFKRK